MIATRADRLLQLLQMLQTSDSATAGEIASALGVSIRTVYRDMDAIQRIGVPLISVAGPGGGYSVLPGYRTVLSGFTSKEIGSLMAAASGADLRELGMDDTLRRAVVKLGTYARGQGQVLGVDPNTVLIDGTPWEHRDSSEVIPVLIDAISAHRVLELSVAALPQAPGMRLTVQPVGLVHKGTQWHLVCRGTTYRVIAVGSIRAITATDSRFAPDDDFDLSHFWHEWCRRVSSDRRSFTATIAIRRQSADAVQAHLANADARVLCGSSPPASDLESREEVQVTVGFSSFEDARARLLGLGSSVRVISPEALRLSVIDYARECMDANTRGVGKAVR